MDKLLPSLLSFPAHPPPIQPVSDEHYDEIIKSQVKYIKKLPAKSLLQTTSGGEGVLDIINPALNPIPYAFALLARVDEVQSAPKSAQNNTPPEKLLPLWEKIVQFLENFDSRQVRYIGSEILEIITVVAALARHLGQPGAAVSPIASAILRLDPGASTLTSAHLILSRLALESQEYSRAAPILERHILYIPTTGRHPKLACSLRLRAHEYLTVESGLTKKISTQDILEYFSFSGSIFIGLQQWENAAESLENVITYPVRGVAVSKIMVEAYKKWTLVKVLLTGKTPALPPNTNGNASKAFHTIGKPYDMVASLFESGTAPRLNAEITAGTNIWSGDGNAGLMRVVLGAHQKHQIRRLSSLYETIPVSYIAQNTVSAETGVGLESQGAVEALVSNMISQGELRGALVSAQGDQPAFLRFAPTERVSDEAVVERELAEAMGRIETMVEDIKATDHLLTHEKEYLTWVRKQKKKQVGASYADAYGGDDLGWIVGPDDEDLMAVM
ncbi:hypothetical protein VF21_00235 [Pseudogymnoascus sp. 05NY08]|nr:hypothetical protein VF21_00060 [Pseudogymnoascus sp. 05NY08]OBT81007.1 hypothetical protein VF21_00235 [Pseudogymnoascus sp. 05NY08]